MKRRDFLSSGISLSTAFILPSFLSSVCCAHNTKNNPKSRVIISGDASVKNNGLSADSGRLEKILDNALFSLTGRDKTKDAWRQVVRPGEIIGLKVNCLSGHGSTSTVLVDLVCERLQQAGIKKQDIIIWDRLSSDLEDGGYRLYSGKNKRRCFGNDFSGFERNLDIFGSAGSRVTKTLTRICDGIINLPVLRDHSIAGVSIALKNIFGAIHNPHKYHLNGGDPYIADVNMLPSIRGKTRLIICDALEGQYEGGPSFMPQWRWPFNSLIAAYDPVALDYTGWQIIEQKRAAMGLKSLKESGRLPLFIKTAADVRHRLGSNNPKQIEVVSL